MIADKLGRSFKKLRISLTHNCNYSCIYCSYGDKKEVPGQIAADATIAPIKRTLHSSELIGIIKKLHTELKFDVVRLTGGEPLLHPGILKIISALKDMGITNIGMTTNGHTLANRVKDLNEAGLQSVNISIDALSDEKFLQMSRFPGLKRVLNSIDASIHQGLHVKLNSVIVTGKNDDQIIPLLDFSLRKNIVIRFLELMPMGPLHHNREGLFFSSAQMLEVIKSKYLVTEHLRDDGSTAHYWTIDGKKAFGIIANDSSPFCSDCNRLRLDSYGNIYGCLSSLVPVQVNTLMDQTELQSALQLAISHKQLTHFVGNSRTMQSIGG